MRAPLPVRLALGLTCLLCFALPAGAQWAPAYVWATAAGGPLYDGGEAVEVDPAGNVYSTGQFTGTAQVGTATLVSKGETDVYLAKHSPQGQLLWVRQLGGPDRDSAPELALDAAGNVYLAGTFDAQFTRLADPARRATLVLGTTTLTGGSRFAEAFLAAYDAQGTLRWVRHTVAQPSPGNTQGTYDVDLAVAPDGTSYLTGALYGPTRLEQALLAPSQAGMYFLAQFAPDGALQWVHPELGLGIQYQFQVAATAQQVYLLGQFRGALTLGTTTLTAPAPGGYYLAQLDRQGTFLWVRPGVLTPQEACREFVVAPNGNLGVSCEFLGQAAHGGQVFPSRGGPDVLVLAFSPDGAFLWGQPSGSPDPGQGTDQIARLAVDAESNLYTATDLGNTFQVVSYSPTGTVRWTHPTPLYVIDVAAQAPDQVVVTGQLQGGPRSFDRLPPLTSAGGTDAYMAKLVAPPLPPAPPLPGPAVRVPNIITPNGDGRNDTFVVQGLEARAWNLQIFNRWGVPVYHRTPYDNTWAATGQPDGVYFYLLQHAESGRQWKGWVEVKR